MKATYNPDAKTKFTTSHRLEGKSFFSSCSVISLSAKPYPNGEIHEPITLRIYGTGRKNYACLWINSSPIHTSGSGSAGGGGYHRQSAAADEAIRNAGFTLDVAIDGMGDGEIREALLAIAKCLKIKRPAIVSAHP